MWFQRNLLKCWRATDGRTEGRTDDKGPLYYKISKYTFCVYTKHTNTMMIEGTKIIYHTYSVCLGYNNMGTKRLVYVIRGVKTEHNSSGAVCVPFDDPETISYAPYVYLRMQLRGAVCGGKVCIELWSKVYAYHRTNSLSHGRTTPRLAGTPWSTSQGYHYMMVTNNLIPPFHWTAIPLRFEILVKMKRIVAETARAQ